MDGENDMAEKVDAIAREQFGIAALRPLQREVILRIAAATAEKKTLRQTVIMPTGAGKSLCFMIPAAFIAGATLIVYPLLSLMADQKRRLDGAGIRSVVLSGGKSAEELESAFGALEDGANIIIANPEILQAQKIRGRLKTIGIAHLVIDEAHCVSEWGESFRPSYLSLSLLIAELNPVCVSAFTATASPSVLDSMRTHLFGAQNAGDVLRSPGDRANIRYRVIPAFSKIRALKTLCQSCPKPALIFCGTRTKTEETARTLADFFGFGANSIQFYHAGMTKAEKIRTEEWFFQSPDGILCATCAYGMGVDKKNIRTVIHLEPSPTLESYMQEAGRGGRDGGVSEAILLFSHTDFLSRREFSDGDRQKKMLEYASLTSCRRAFLLAEMGEETAVECAGCDVCRGDAVFEAQDALAVQNIVRAQNRCLSEKSLAAALIAKNWTIDEALDVISQLFSAHKINKCGFLWKNRICV